MDLELKRNEEIVSRVRAIKEYTQMEKNGRKNMEARQKTADEAKKEVLNQSAPEAALDLFPRNGTESSLVPIHRQGRRQREVAAAKSVLQIPIPSPNYPKEKKKNGKSRERENAALALHPLRNAGQKQEQESKGREPKPWPVNVLHSPTMPACDSRPSTNPRASRRVSYAMRGIDARRDHHHRRHHKNTKRAGEAGKPSSSHIQK
ncbi:hypothetical protein K438DRAFT_1771753 [Mycena galopus ATCC 62051]|nr:hypothetical protein K438DRAFT_1771753 [Mycena galopus ATCC 62051]